LIRKDLTVVVLVEEFLDLSRRSNDLSVNFASARAGVVSSVAVDRGVDLAVELAHVVGVEDGDLISFIGRGFSWEVRLVARITGVRLAKFVESFSHSAGVSASPFFFRNELDDTLKSRVKMTETG
jgi:hypothetical protein